MNIKLDPIRFAAPVFLAGVAIVAFSSSSLEKGGHFEYQPNPGALAKSPFGRTVGMALQGPVVRFWDRGIGSVSKEQKLVEASRPDERLFNFISELRIAKGEGNTPAELHDDYEDFAMAKIEKKLSLAWKMDPRNFANYSIYQMFLWEGFNDGVIESDMKVRELSLQTLQESLEDNESPTSLLTAGQAAYDLVFTARTAKDQSPEETFRDVDTYSQMLPGILGEYEELVAAMQRDGRWDAYSDAKKNEFGDRKNYLERLNNETRVVLEQLTNSGQIQKGGRSS
jgi:hypothetical protein